MIDACGKELKVGQTVMYAERFGSLGSCNIKAPEKVLVIIEEAPENVDN